MIKNLSILLLTLLSTTACASIESSNEPREALTQEFNAVICADTQELYVGLMQLGFVALLSGDSKQAGATTTVWTKNDGQYSITRTVDDKTCMIDAGDGIYLLDTENE